MFQIRTDADHVNEKGLLKQGRGSTGKKHEERESKKWTKQTTWNEATDRVRVHVRFCSPFSKKSYDYPVCTLVSLIKCSSSKVQMYSGAECKWTSQSVSLNFFFVLIQEILNGEYIE